MKTHTLKKPKGKKQRSLIIIDWDSDISYSVNYNTGTSLKELKQITEIAEGSLEGIILRHKVK